MSTDSSNHQCPGYWKNGLWIDLSSAVPGDLGAEAYMVRIIGGVPYLAGSTTTGVLAPGYFANGALTQLTYSGSTSDPGGSGYAWDIGMVGNAICVAGDRSVLQGTTTISEAGYWDAGTWQTLPVLDQTKASDTSTIAVSGSDWYIAGWTTDTSGVANPGYWKGGTTWVGLPRLDQTHDAFANYILVDGTDIYVGGYSLNASGVAVPGYWKDGTWTTLSSADQTKDTKVYAFQVVN